MEEAAQVALLVAGEEGSGLIMTKGNWVIHVRTQATTYTGSLEKPTVML